MSFPADIKGCMKDCILSLFWPRKDIVGFFEKHGCTKTELSGLQIEGEGGLKRHEIIDGLFSKLDARYDNGLGPFRAMLQSLLTWSHFDPYYFDKLRKLDRAVATRNLEHLKQLQEIRDAKIKSDREVTGPKVGKLRVVEIGPERTVRRPAIDLLPYTVGTSEIAHDLRFEKTPEKGEVKDDASVWIRKIPKAGRARFQP